MKLSEFIAELRQNGLPSSMDFKSIVLPFLKKVQTHHLDYHVILKNASTRLEIEDLRLRLREVNPEIPHGNPASLFKKELQAGPILVTRKSKVEIDTETGLSTSNIPVFDLDDIPDPLKEAIYITDFRTWEEQLGHYDPLSEIYVCGLIIASIAFGLHLAEKNALRLFISSRENLGALNPHLHQSIVKVIRDMTALHREDRIQNLEDVIFRIEEFGTFNPELTTDLTEAAQFKKKPERDRQEFILDRLKSRLYDISRRNRLIYYKEQGNFVNLTISSVPVLLDYRNIQEDDIFFWSSKIKSAIMNLKPINLDHYLHIKDTPNVSNRLDRIRLDARKSLNEYGFSQLRLVVAFLHWFNFKEDKNEKIKSPLLLLPVGLSKKKGVRDKFILAPQDSVLEVNPVLSHHLEDLFDIKLPETVDLNEQSITDLVSTIEQQIAQSESSIVVRWRSTPEIEIIHAVAKKNFSINLRKSNKRSRQFRLSEFSYSYEQGNYRPLGLEIFKNKVKYQNNQLEYLINEDLKPDEEYFARQKERNLYTNKNQGTKNPYLWEIDTCNMTLGNFNYRKMSLVNDYEKILAERLKCSAFDELFSVLPTKASEYIEESSTLDSDFSIISSDPTQSKAVTMANSGLNYIIQGPPGTGKSQTITNLIAQYIASGKKVLFVCEKRAALDVVFHRLKQKNLDELCCLVHDSQSDKKSFIMDLKATYERFLKNKLKRSAINKKRKTIIEKMSANRSSLESYHRYLSDPISQEHEVTASQLLQLVIDHEARHVSNEDWMDYPDYFQFDQERSTIEQWFDDHQQGRYGPFLKDYPLIRAGRMILESVNPHDKVEEFCRDIIPSLDMLVELVDMSEFPSELFEDVEQIKSLLLMLIRVSPMIQRNTIEVFQEDSQVRGLFKKILEERSEKTRLLKEQEEQNSCWTQKLEERDANAARSQWNKYMKNPFRFIFPGYYKLKKLIRSSVDLASFRVAPDLGLLLEDLIKELSLREELRTVEKSLAEIIGEEEIEEKISSILSPSKEDITLIQLLNAQDKSDLNSWLESSTEILLLFDRLEALDSAAGRLLLSQVKSKVEEWRKAALSLSTHVPYLKESISFPNQLRQALLSRPWSPKDLEWAAAYKSLSLYLERNVRLKNLDTHGLKHLSEKVKTDQKKLQELNVEFIRSAIRDEFEANVELSEQSVREMSQEDRERRKNYRAARKILENEFGKSMRYKSIRELSTGDARHMLIDLKPIWLMSPLSVSDVLTLDKDLFDVVIFDEASQITLEEGIPALYRSRQTIIVGDEMQMPPTNFFSTSSRSIDEEEEMEEAIGINLDADSLLNQGARKLDSVMLGWHYRSRHESLIAFCNAAFYAHQLLTIPDVRFHDDALRSMEELVMEVNSEVETDVQSILDRSISYHHLSDSVYEKRSNLGEADYIARLVRDLVRFKPELTIGVVAFSMQQQNEIEMALERLAAIDKDFDRLLEQEYSRVEDNQVVALFVKNLENVQGDERDIIIMSVCYGPNDSGKMLMNFGPINRRGGEKRLNVIFSRAKRHMMVVSSILSDQIKNDYNEGALYFKRFLEYAKNISDGEIGNAQALIERMGKEKEEGEVTLHMGIVDQLARALEERGHHVDRGIGQSRFKVHLAIRDREDARYTLGIVVDDETHYANENAIEQYCQKPEVLSGFGWSIYYLYSKDWFLRKEQVLHDIDTRLAGIINKAT